MACDACLARGLLLRGLAANIDRAVRRGAGGRARDLLALTDPELAAAVTPHRRRTGQALAEARSGAALAALRAQLQRHSCDAVCRHQPGWPDSFGRLGDAAPRALFLRGDRSLLAAGSDIGVVTIVGSRRAGAYGREVAAGLACELAAVGILVVSGMAFGADAAAHEGALAAPGATVAVLGSGPERAYPRSGSRLYRRICESGLVISELPPGSPTFRWTFPARNRLMAALAGMTVVVESAERSGSLITAEMAGDCGRVVGAVPGPVNAWRSAGTNQLLVDGATVVRGAGDVLDHLVGVGVRLQPRSGSALAGAERSVLELAEDGHASADGIAAVAGLAVADVVVALSRLELAGYLESAPSGYLRTALRAPDPEIGAATMAP